MNLNDAGETPINETTTYVWRQGDVFKAEKLHVILE